MKKSNNWTSRNFQHWQLFNFEILVVLHSLVRNFEPHPKAL